MAGDRCAIGIDLGGTNIFGGLVDGSGRLVATAKRPTPASEGHGAVFAVMKVMIRELLAQTGGRRVAGIGLGIPGLLDRAAGISILSPNLGWRQVPVRPEFAEFGLPLEMDNDVRCHALGELHFGAARGASDVILITLGTGIGSGIILNGALYRGSAGLAGEIGHIPLEPGGPLCGCGKRGCFEAVAGGNAIGRRAQEAGIGATARELFEKAATGDEQALTLVDRVAYDLGRGISAYVNVMNPQRVIVGGGVAQAGELLLAPLRRYARAETMPGIRDTFAILPATLGDEAGAVGAAALIPGLAQV